MTVAAGRDGRVNKHMGPEGARSRYCPPQAQRATRWRTLWAGSGRRHQWKSTVVAPLVDHPRLVPVVLLGTADVGNVLH